MKKKQIFGWLVLSVLLGSCAKFENDTLAGNLQYTVSVRQGSYLVMKDSVYGSIDTLHISRYFHPHQVYFSFANNYDTTVKKKIHLSFYVENKSRSLIMNLAYSDNNLSDFSSNYITVYQEPFTIGPTNDFDRTSTENYAVSKYNNYNVLGQTYQTVFESRQEISSQNPDNNIEYNFWYSMHTGIIKMRMKSTTELRVLELLDSKIIR